MENKRNLRILFTDGTEIDYAMDKWDKAQIEGGTVLVIYKNKLPILVAPLRNFYAYEMYEVEQNG